MRHWRWEGILRVLLLLLLKLLRDLRHRRLSRLKALLHRRLLAGETSILRLESLRLLLSRKSRRLGL